MITVEAAVARHFQNAPFTRANTGDTRIFGHDFLHALLGTRANSDRAEEVVAIYQAVLLGDAHVSTRSSKEWRDYGPPPTLQQVRELTIPGARNFVNDTVATLTRTHRFDSATLARLAERHPLADRDIDRHYHAALQLRERIHAQTGKNLGHIPISDLRAMDFEELQGLVPGAALSATTKGTARLRS
jgi:hypothetical protein